jgi:hypothetical protein
MMRSEDSFERPKRVQSIMLCLARRNQGTQVIDTRFTTEHPSEYGVPQRAAVANCSDQL